MKKKGAAMDDYHLMADFFGIWRPMNYTNKKYFYHWLFSDNHCLPFARCWLHEWLISRKKLRPFYFQNHEALACERKRKAEPKTGHLDAINQTAYASLRSEGRVIAFASCFGRGRGRKVRAPRKHGAG
tara:strand:- start:14 stop:397 length:384 start_codon:yes stop_codon:yes gene_type:complete